MAVNRFKIALNNARFPLVSTKAQRAVFVPGLDSAPRLGRGFTGTDSSVDFNTAQVIYAENVMPVSEGLRSVGYEQLIAPTVNSDFDSVFALRDQDENTVLYSPSAGKNYVYDDSANAWTSSTFTDIFGFPVTIGNPANSQVTYAYVAGYTFVCYSRIASDQTHDVDMSIMLWDASTQELTPATSLISNLIFFDSVGTTPTPGTNGWFPVGTIDGIAASNGYLIVWSGLEVAWAPFSITEGKFNFASYSNGAATGAGRQTPEDVQGPITAITSVPGGFIVFTTRNAIGASYYAQSIASPWLFREIPNAGGLLDYEQAAVEGSLAKIAAYTSAGFQYISLNSAESLFPEVSDFIAGRQTERYEFGTHSLVRGGTASDLYTKVTAIGNRYIVLSYGYYPKLYSYALIYDIALERWGKLRVVHKDAFYYTQPRGTVQMTYSTLQDISYEDTNGAAYNAFTVQEPEVTAAQHSLAFLLATGEVKGAIWSDQARAVEDAAVVVIGRVQLSRNRNIQLSRTEIEGIDSGNVVIQPSYDGRTLETAEALTTIVDNDRFRISGGLIDCKNFNLAVEGTFNLSTVILEATTSGTY